MNTFPIAIVGLNFILPGEIDTLNKLWVALNNKQTFVTKFKDANRNAIENDFLGSFIDNVKQFDSSFFKILSNEATYIDPQQRLLLQATWAAIEDAGYNPNRLEGSNTGVYIAVSNSDYRSFLVRKEINNIYGAVGNSPSILANRISNIFDFHGPSLTIDTACSGSLYALHTAINALRLKQCEQCIVGAANLILDDSLYQAFHEAGLLSKDGKCKTFDESADGYGRSEAVISLVIKPLEDALLQSDNIYAVIRHMEVNHNGRSLTITSPSVSAQKDLLINTYKNSGITLDQVNYIELHGTGTRIGDAIEIEALKDAYEATAYSPRFGSCAIGSIKANFGHTEAAAGLTGLLKLIACMQQRKLVPQVNVDNVNALFDLTHSPYFIPLETMDWSTDINEPLRAGLSSFGFGGANAHLILEEYQNSIINEVTTGSFCDYQVVILSAKTKCTLRQQAINLYKYLGENYDLDNGFRLCDISYNLMNGRLQMPYRLGFICRSISNLTDMLSQYISNEHHTNDHIYVNDTGSHSSDRHKMPLYFDNSMNLESIKELISKWTSGATILYRSDYLLLNRLHLPTYPFSGESYWMGDNVHPHRSAKSANYVGTNDYQTICNKLLVMVSDMTDLQISELSLNAPIVEYGVDSLSGVNLVERINNEFAVKIKITIFLSKPSIHIIAQEIERHSGVLAN